MIYKLKIAETPNTATDIFCRFDWLVRLILADIGESDGRNKVRKKRKSIQNE